MDNKRIVIIGGGTVSWVRSHLALAAPAYGTTARALAEMCEAVMPELDVDLQLTRMAGGHLETNEDVAALVDSLVKDDRTKVVFFPAAMTDWNGKILSLEGLESGKRLKRVSTNASPPWVIPLVALSEAEKVIRRIRQTRKDIFLVGFKQTDGATEDEQYLAGLDLCKRASCNLVLANDTITRLNMVVTPEEARYHVTHQRSEALAGLVNMTKLRSHLTFTRSTVISGEPVSWSSSEIPESLRTVVNFCIGESAYKPFNGTTAGHFACKINDTTFLTSQRKTNFNDLPKVGLVKIVTDGPDTVLAYGAKPSVGGQSQRIVFKDHPGLDCIVHFHCPIKEGSEVPQCSQYEFECGSHECGQNTSNGLKQFGNLKAVYLENHGPNIVFNRNIDPQEVINFIKDNFDLSQKTGGFVSAT